MCTFAIVSDMGSRVWLNDVDYIYEFVLILVMDFADLDALLSKHLFTFLLTEGCSTMTKVHRRYRWTQVGDAKAANLTLTNPTKTDLRRI